jgi:hypothetical protein
MAIPVEPRTTWIGPYETYGTEEVVRYFHNGLYTVTEEDTGFAITDCMHIPLRIDTEGARLLTLHVAEIIVDHVRCDMKTYHLTALHSFLAIQNA